MKRLITGFWLLCLISGVAQAAPEAKVVPVSAPEPKVLVCANKTEFQALNMRALQSELMVAALSCGQKTHYNWFAKEYGSKLVDYGTEIMGFFDRHGSTDSTKLLNDFITKMANRASRASLMRPQRQYCGEVATLYTALKGGKFSTVEKLANRYYPGWHHIPQCKS